MTVGTKHYGYKPQACPRGVRLRASSPGLYPDIRLVEKPVTGATPRSPCREQYMFVEFIPIVSNRRAEFTGKTGHEKGQT